MFSFADAFAVASHARATAAWDDGVLGWESFPIPGLNKAGEEINLLRDEGIREGMDVRPCSFGWLPSCLRRRIPNGLMAVLAQISALGQMRAAFDDANGQCTAGNSSQARTTAALLSSPLLFSSLFLVLPSKPGCGCPSMQLSDGAAAILVSSAAAAAQHGWPVLARIVDQTSVALAPEAVMAAPIPAVRKLLQVRERDQHICTHGALY
jgi:acetyl-CoA acetyltransferase